MTTTQYIIPRSTPPPSLLPDAVYSKLKRFLEAGTHPVPKTPRLRVATTVDSEGGLSLILYGQGVAAAAAVASTSEAALRLWDVLARLRGGKAGDSPPAGGAGLSGSIWAELTWFDPLLLPCAAGARVRRLVPEILRGLVRRQLESVAAPEGIGLVENNFCENLP